MKTFLLCLLFAFAGCAHNSDRAPSSTQRQNEEATNRALQHQMPNAPVSTPMAY